MASNSELRTLFCDSSLAEKQLDGSFLIPLEEQLEVGQDHVLFLDDVSIVGQIPTISSHNQNLYVVEQCPNNFQYAGREPMLPDGSLLVIDTGGWFRIGCPVSKVAKPDIHGAIYRIRRKGAHKVKDPRGRFLGAARLTPAALARHLDDARPVVRERVIDRLALAGIDAIGTLEDVLA